MKANFAVFILTHGRPDNVITFKTLRKCGYTGRIILLVDNEDAKQERYHHNFSYLENTSVIVFDKKALADDVDEGNNFDERRTITHARNACFKIAKELNIRFFIQLDDDYKQFKFRFENKLGYEAVIKDLDRIFDSFVTFLETTPTKSIAFSQGGDHIGGFTVTKLKRKAMNSFFCSTDDDKAFKFVGAMNEDVNTYTTLGARGNLFFTFTSVQLDQKETQSQEGGITGMYLRYGTYCKAFTTVMMQPSSVKVSMLNTNYQRLHHQIDWPSTTPKIIDARFKKIEELEIPKESLRDEELWHPQLYPSQVETIEEEVVEPPQVVATSILPDDFAIFILTHGRPDQIFTLKALKEVNYRGKIFFIVDNEDAKLDRYKQKYGEDRVKVFDKKEMADLVDEGNNFDERRTITHARNACFNIAEELGLKYFLQLDDDYTAFRYRLLVRDEPQLEDIKNIEPIFALILDYYKRNEFKSIAIAQGGDFLGGLDNGKKVYRFSKRKCMNTFFCSTERKFQFVGAMNEDVNTYMTLGSRGELFLTIPFVSIDQKASQSQSGGITEMYLRFGTYCKAFTTLMMQPSSVRVSMMRSNNPRLHHSIAWSDAVPTIISPKFKKKRDLLPQGKQDDLKF